MASTSYCCLFLLLQEPCIILTASREDLSEKKKVLSTQHNRKITSQKIISCQKVILDTEGCAEIQRAKIVLFTKGYNFKIVFGQCANKRQVRLSRKYQLFQDNLERALSLSLFPELDMYPFSFLLTTFRPLQN